MQIIYIVFIFIFGLVLGSFVNALEYRITEKISMKGRSFCPECKHRLSWEDLVPVFSWLFLRGKCRYCQKPISAQYPIIELLSGISLVVTSYDFGILDHLSKLTSLGFSFILLGQFIFICIVSTTLILVALHDYKTGYILSYYVYFAIAISVVLVAFPSGSFAGLNSIIPCLYSAIGAATPFFVIWAVSGGKWMGAGDIEVAFLLGILLGWPATIVGMYFAFIIGSIVAIALVIAKKTELKSHISFGPFLVAGIYFGLTFGQQIADIYAKMFLGF